MKLRTHRLRRVAAAAALGVGTVGGVIGFAAGTAGAAIAGATISAKSAPSVASTGSGQKAGTLTLTLPATGGAGGTIKLVVAATAAHDVIWTSDTVSSSGGTAIGTITAAAKTTLVIKAAKAVTAKETITITGITYTTTKAHGTVSVTPTAAVYSFKPSSVVNAVAPAKPATPPATTVVVATSATKVIPGKNGQAAGTWAITITGKKGTAWAKTEVVTIDVFTPTGTNCSSTHGYILFTGTPKATVTGSSHASTTPKVTASVSHGPTCAVSTDHNQLTVVFTNTGTFTATTGTITIVVSGVKYNIGAKTATGTVEVAYTEVNGTKVAKSATTTVSNATVATLYVSANTPPVHVAKKAIDAGISPVKVFSDVADGVSGYVCLSLSSGHFNPSATATAKQTGGATGKTTPKVVYQTAGGATTTKATTVAFARFHVVTEVTKTLPVTYTVSGLKVNSATTAATVTVKDGANTKCTADVTKLGTAKAFTIATTTVQVYGATADATAAAEFQRAFPSTKLTTTGGKKVHISCPGTRAAVVATTVKYQDALSSQFLAQSLTTGTLLTPTTKLAQVTATTLRREGINTVYVVGGPLAITTTVFNDIAALPAYKCGGTTRTATTGTIVVHRIYGATAEGTAMSIAEFVGKAPGMSFLGAYTTPTATPNSAGGNGRYNDTAGKASKLPSSGATLTTAILASATEFQDAQAASVLAYHTGIPMLLTSPTKLSTTAESAFSDLHVQQVILLGGQLAVDNTVEAALVAKGLSVLRVAGSDYTDTARELADFEANTAAGGLGLGWTVGGRILVARGNGFTDGLAGAVLDNKNNAATGGSHEHPLLLTESPTVVGTYLTTFLKIAGHTGIDGRGGGNKVTALTILGGPLAVSPAEIADMQTDLAH